MPSSQPWPSPIYSPRGSAIYYRGPAISQGLKPAVIFFALSAQTSLYEHPFDPFTLALAESDIRIFSWDLPFHEHGQDPHQAMQGWASKLAQNPLFLSDFIEKCQDNMQYLFDQKWMDFSQLALVGLSRGGWIATHLAAKDPRVKAVLGFAPLVQTQQIEEFYSLSPEQHALLALTPMVHRLIHTHVRFYMGNRDTRVGTDACYSFIRALAEEAFDKGIRSPSAELTLYPSIGFKGHGTPPSIFQAGADWIKAHLLK